MCCAAPPEGWTPSTRRRLDAVDETQAAALTADVIDGIVELIPGVWIGLAGVAAVAMKS